MESVLLILLFPLTILIGATVITMLAMSAALVKLINQLRFYFYIMTEAHNQSLKYPRAPISVGKKEEK